MVDSSGVNWGLGLQQTNPGNAFMDAFKQGQTQRRQDTARQAMSVLVQNPNDPKALAALAQVDPASAMEFRKQQIEYSKAQLAQHQDSILKGAEIIRETNPTDQASWTRTLALAQQAGVDVTQVPQQFNQEYVQGVMHLADAWKPQTSDNMKIITPQPGGGAYGWDPRSNQTQTIIAPNDDPKRTGQPVQGGAVAHVTDQQSYDAIPPGTQYTTPDGHVRMKPGGQSVAPAGGFPGHY